VQIADVTVRPAAALARARIEPSSLRNPHRRSTCSRFSTLITPIAKPVPPSSVGTSILPWTAPVVALNETLPAEPYGNCGERAVQYSPVAQPSFRKKALDKLRARSLIAASQFEG